MDFQIHKTTKVKQCKEQQPRLIINKEIEAVINKKNKQTKKCFDIKNLGLYQVKPKLYQTYKELQPLLLKVFKI